MSLEAMLAAHDAPALAALTNKGLVRRAARDAEAGLAKVLHRDGETAKVRIEGFEMTVTAGGPDPAHCPCPATGLCRHILTAIFVLRSEAAPAADDGSVGSVKDELLELGDQEVKKFAGADFAAAALLATSQPKISNEGNMLQVTFAEVDKPVQFIPGRQLKDAVFKGPASRARLVKAAAVLAVKLDAGQKLETDLASKPDPAGISEGLLDDVAQGLEMLVSATLRGGAMAATDQVFDLAISARAQAAPRLTGLLRGLVMQAQLSAMRHVSFEPERFLAEAAEGYALVEALRSDPSDLTLLGALQRAYLPAQPLTFWALGAQSWQNPSGARGLRVYGFDPDAKRWLSAGQARAAGADPGFTPRRAYQLSLLSAGSAEEMMGRRIEIAEPRLSDDLQLAPTTTGQKAEAVSRDALLNSGAVFTGWAEAHEDLRRRQASGLRQRGAAYPVLLAPTRIDMQGFDDIAQTYELILRDTQGETLPLVIPAKDADAATWLTQIGRELAGLLCVPRDSLSDRGRALSPVSVLTTGKVGLVITNLSLDPAPTKKSLVSTFVNRWRGPAKSVRAVHDPLTAETDAVLRYLVDALAGGNLDSTQLEARLDAAGLALLSQALGRFGQQPTTSNALKAAYLANRLAALHMMSAA